LLTANPHPTGHGYSTLEFAMNIELDEVVIQDVSDDALELAAGGAQRGPSTNNAHECTHSRGCGGGPLW
jgi:hypothetical protein